MTCSWQVRIEPNCVTFRVTGENSVANVRSYLYRIADVCERNGHRRVLIEEDLTGPRLYSADVVAVVKELAPRAARVFERLAYVDVSVGATPGMEFAADLAAQFGANVRVFGDAEAARRWLLGAGES